MADSRLRVVVNAKDNASGPLGKIAKNLKGLGVAAGIGVAAVGLAAVFRANKMVCIPVVWITNAITAAPIYWACLAIGKLLLPASASAAEQADTLERLSATGGISQFFTLAFWGDLFGSAANLGAELWLGCALVGIVGGIVAYFASRWAVVAYREKHKHVIARRRARIFRAKARRARRATREPV